MGKSHGRIIFFEKDENLFFCYEELNGIAFQHKFMKRIPLESLDIHKKGGKAIDVFVKKHLAEYFKNNGTMSELRKNFRKPFVKSKNLVEKEKVYPSHFEDGLFFTDVNEIGWEE